MTINVSDSVVIATPVDMVFAFVADHENLPAWTVGVKQSRRLTAGPLRLLAASTASWARFWGGRSIPATRSPPSSPAVALREP